MMRLFTILVGALLIASCVHPASFPVEKGTVAPGSKVTRGGQPIPLYPGNLKVGDSVALQLKDLGADIDGKVALVNFVPSIDTPVCEAQSHQLSESKEINASIVRVVLSRDTSMAQQRFVRESGLNNLVMGSDFRTGDFGKRTGLLMQGPELLARGVMVVNSKGIVVYLQVVPEIAALPDLERAIQVANDLVK